MYKILLLGDAYVGKTSVTMRYTENNFSTNYLQTISIDVQHKETFVDGEKIKVQIWDTAGQEQFKRLAPMYYKNAAAAIICYDVTSPKSFETLECTYIYRTEILIHLLVIFTKRAFIDM